ncbi:MAG TPA: ribonuclease H-like domain-containing protein [Bryobacteraceae bacterium]|nr:ribonuclease H-like domain-containing protein [Bryobacteraceae bacterium]
MDIREQLALLRRKIDGIDARYADAPPPAAPRREKPGSLIEDLVSGEVVTTQHGSHFETERHFPIHHRHGSYEISDLAALSPDLLSALSSGAIEGIPPDRWLFLDTETTGLAGGSGTYAFLVGAGSIAEDGFRVRQFFMRDYSEEASLLDSLSSYMSRFDAVITYNGRSYDQPLLETRYTMCRARHPFSRMEHLDLLYGARRLFRLRLENCRLSNLENQILGYEREGDIPGEMIPYCYFEYLRTRRAHRLPPILHHNVLDIISLACLTGVIPEAFRDPVNARARHGTDLLGLARWLQISGRLDEAHHLFRRAVDMGLPDEHLFAALFAAGTIEKKQGRADAAIATFTDLSLSPNPFRIRAYEELAMHYEHRERSFTMALECVRAARAIEDSAALQRRYERLVAKCSRTPRMARRLALN